VLIIKDLTRSHFPFAQPLLLALQTAGLNYKIETTKNIDFPIIKQHDTDSGQPELPETILAVIDHPEQIKTGSADNTIYYPVLLGPEVLDYIKEFKEEFVTGQCVAAILPESGVPFAFGSVSDCLDLIYHRQATTNGPKQILIDAGPTVEDIDPVRFISNRSTGKMGIAMARAAFRAGNRVRMIAGPLQQRLPGYLEVKQVRSAAEMAEAVRDLFTGCDWFFAVAAVADFRPAHYQPQKIKKQGEDQKLNIELSRTTDILQSLKAIQSNQKMIGFSVETNNILENSLYKMQRKGLNAIIVNNPLEAGSGFAHETNRVSILWPDGRRLDLPLRPKLEVAEKIFTALGESL
jgi:hypothetical protein